MGNFFFFRELDFKKLFIRDIVGQIAFLVVAIPWALVQPSVVALFAGHLAQTLASILVTYALHEHRPRFSFYFKRLKDLSSYGSWVMAQNVLMQANSIVESTVVGRILGPRDLGLYSRANSVASLPSSAIMTVIYKVGFPAYARVQDSTEKVAQGFVKSYDIALSTLLPFLFVVLFAGGPLVGILLGSQWVDMVLAMKILVVSLTLEAFSTITYPILEGIGKVDVRFKLSLLQIVLTLPLMYLFASMFGISGAALGVVITSLAVFSVSSYWALRSLFVRISDIGNSFLTR